MQSSKQARRGLGFVLAGLQTGSFGIWSLAAGCNSQLFNSLTEPQGTQNTEPMEIELSPELQAKLDRIASQQGRDTKSLVHEAVERLVGYDEWFIRQVEKGLDQVDRGELLEQEDVAASMENLIAPK